MNPSAVIETLDVVKDALPSLGAALIPVVEDKFPLQNAEEALRRCIVPAIASAAHAADHAVFKYQFLKVFTEREFRGLWGHPLKGCCQRQRLPHSMKTRCFQLCLPVTAIVTIAVISFLF
jgi:hypothetical protein